MGIMNTLRKYCIIKSVRDKAKEELEKRPHDRYDEPIPYVGISGRRFMLTTKEDEIEEIRKEIGKNIDQHISKLSKNSVDELNSLYENVKKEKSIFGKNENVWSRAGKLDEKADMVFSGFDRLLSAIKDEIERQNKTGLK